MSGPAAAPAAPQSPLMKIMPGVPMPATGAGTGVPSQFGPAGSFNRIAGSPVLNAIRGTRAGSMGGTPRPMTPIEQLTAEEWGSLTPEQRLTAAQERFGPKPAEETPIEKLVRGLTAVGVEPGEAVQIAKNSVTGQLSPAAQAKADHAEALQKGVEDRAATRAAQQQKNEEDRQKHQQSLEAHEAFMPEYNTAVKTLQDQQKNAAYLDDQVNELQQNAANYHAAWNPIAQAKDASTVSVPGQRPMTKAQFGSLMDATDAQLADAIGRKNAAWQAAEESHKALYGYTSDTPPEKRIPGGLTARLHELGQAAGFAQPANATTGPAISPAQAPGNVQAPAVTAARQSQGLGQGKPVTPDFMPFLKERFGTDKEAARQWLLNNGYAVN